MGKDFSDLLFYSGIGVLVPGTLKERGTFSGKFRSLQGPMYFNSMRGFLRAFKNAALVYSDNITAKVLAFDKKAQVASARIPEQELTLLIRLPHQHHDFIIFLGKHWDNYKSPQSGVTHKALHSVLTEKLPNSKVLGKIILYKWKTT